MFLLLRALPGMTGVVLKAGKWDRGCTTRQGVEPWKASWQQVQKSKRQLRRVHVALWDSAECVAGEPHRLQERRDSCCFKLLAAWTKEQHTHTFLKQEQCTVFPSNPNFLTKPNETLYTNSPAYILWSVYTGSWACCPCERDRPVCWPCSQRWRRRRRLECLMRRGSACRTAPPWTQPHLSSDHNHFFSESCLTPKKEEKGN